MKSVFIRTDANHQIGTGHLMRCILLAEKLKKKFAVFFLLADTPIQLKELIQSKGFKCVDCAGKELSSPVKVAIREITSLAKVDDSMLLVDSDDATYYDQGFQKGVLQSGIRLMHITFKHKPVFYSHILHNQNPLALKHTYHAQEYTRLLLGPRYLILKDEYAELRPQALADYSSALKRILLFFGGADQYNLSERVLESLFCLGFSLEVDVVIGSLYRHSDSLKKRAMRYADTLRITIYQDTPLMPQLMAQADAAITSGGLSVWELACLGVPNAVIPTSEREIKSAALLSKAGVVYYLQQFDDNFTILPEKLEGFLSNSARRDQLHANSQKLTDGQGIRRVVDEIVNLMT